MRKKVFIGISVIIAAAAAVLILYMFFSRLNFKKYEGIGNSGGNIANSGMIAENDEYVFISSLSGNKNGIFKKSKNDGTVTKICEDRAIYLNFYDGDLYYVNLSDNGFIYKINDDGDDREKKGDFENCEYLSFLNENVFFEFADSDSGNIYNPYKIDDDFDNLVKLNDDDVEGLISDGKYLYYSNWSDGGKIYKMKADGTEKTKLNDTYSGFLNVYDGWVYYTNDNDNYKIYKMKTDGSENTVLCEDSCGYFNCDGGYIYYSNNSDSNKIYKIGADGNGKTKISDKEGSLIFIADSKVFYINTNDGNIYSLDFDGSNEKIVIE